LTTIGTSLHLKERFNTSLAGIFGLLPIVPVPPETVDFEQEILHNTPMLLYSGEAD
jgi:hypothetical protein